jgi:hypothetical protein
MQRQTSKSGCRPAKTDNLPQILMLKPRHARGFVCADLARSKADPVDIGLWRLLADLRIVPRFHGAL